MFTIKRLLPSFFICSFFILQVSLLNAQKQEMDSLGNILKTGKCDTGLVNAINDLAGKLIDKGAYRKSDSIARIALSLSEKLNFKIGIATAANNIGNANYDQGNYPTAIDNYLMALKIYGELENQKGIATVTGNIGLIYNDQGDYSKALDFYMKALKIEKDIGDNNGMIHINNNLGVLYDEIQNYPQALKYDSAALAAAEKLGDKNILAGIVGNIASIYGEQGNFEMALEYYFNVLTMEKEIGDQGEIAITIGNIGETYLIEKNYREAKKYLSRGITLADSINSLYEVKDMNLDFSNLYSETKQWQKALEAYKRYTAAKDSLLNQEKSNQIGRLEAEAEYDKKTALQKAAEDKKDALADADKRKQNMIIWSITSGFLLLFVLAAFIFRSLRITRKQKQNIENKNKVIEEKNRDILDSIIYAKRLQDAILPPMSLIKQFLPESFVLYKPKDIVAGDFYWMEHTGDIILIAAADCTGHGVPGALVSVVCSNALNRTVKEFHITEPGKILDKVRDLVLETFEKSENTVQDGMDISLLCINTKTKEAQWSGAYNSIWFIRNNEMYEVDGDKQPIGKNDTPTPFNSHNLNLLKNDILYLFTDGYADQFGGPKGKKYKYKQLQEKLLSIASLPMEQQKMELEKILIEWKGKLEQVDDILVIGIKI